MKRSLIVLCVAALLATLPLASVAEARRHGRPGRATKRARVTKRAKPARRARRGCQTEQPEEVMVEIYHVRVVDIGAGTAVALCELMEVPESEVAEHLAHGDRTDSTEFSSITEYDRWFLVDYLGIDIGNAHWFFYL